MIRSSAAARRALALVLAGAIGLGTVLESGSMDGSQLWFAVMAIVLCGWVVYSERPSA